MKPLRKWQEREIKQLENEIVQQEVLLLADIIDEEAIENNRIRLEWVKSCIQEDDPFSSLYNIFVLNQELTPQLKEYKNELLEKLKENGTITPYAIDYGVKDIENTIQTVGFKPVSVAGQEVKGFILDSETLIKCIFKGTLLSGVNVSSLYTNPRKEYIMIKVLEKIIEKCHELNYHISIVAVEENLNTLEQQAYRSPLTNLCINFKISLSLGFKILISQEPVTLKGAYLNTLSPVNLQKFLDMYRAAGFTNTFEG